MRLPRFQFTLRRMMVAVAIVGSLLAYAGYVMDRASDLLQASIPPPVPGWTPRPHIVLDELAHFLARYVLLPLAVAYLGFVGTWLIRKKRAACNPWLPVAPETPEPK